MGNSGLQILAERDHKNMNYANAWEKVGRRVDDEAAGDFERASLGMQYEQVPLKSFYKMCKAGDILLIREKVQIIPNVFVPASIARQVASSSTTGRFGGDKVTNCPMWNRGGVICLNDGVKSVIEGTATGIEVKPLKEVLKALKNTRAIVAVRSLRSMNKAFYASQLAPLVETLATDRGVQWMTLLVEKRQAAAQQQQEALLSHTTSSSSSDAGRTSGGAEPQEGPSPSSSSSSPPPSSSSPPGINTAEDVTAAVLHGVKKQVLAVHPSMEYEALRVFYELDDRGSGELAMEDCIKAVGKLADEAMPMNSAKASRYLQDRARSLLSVLVDNREKECRRLNKMTGQVDIVIRFEDFLEVYRALPLLYVPVEHDIQGILAGQVIVAIYRYLRVVADSTRQDWSDVTITHLSSRSFVQVDLDVDHMLGMEIICKIK